MEPFLGQIQAFGFNFAPRGWAFCEGQLLPISSNTALFSLLGTTYGGDGRTTFGLPDLRGRSIVGVGNGPGLDNISWGQKGGSTQLNITTANLPAHAHAAETKIAVSTAAGEESSPTTIIAAKDASFSEDATANAFLGGVSSTTQNTGSNTPVQSRNPYLGMYYSIALVGIYPPRN